jgi:predicted TIM-barrel fold metal-dependent hydrolase
VTPSVVLDELGDNLQLVLGHGGELLLFWTDRADSLSSLAGLDRKVSDYVRSNVHITSAGMFDPALLRHVLEVTTPDRLLFSSDHPFQRPDKDGHREVPLRGPCSLFGIDITSRKEQQ